MLKLHQTTTLFVMIQNGTCFGINITSLSDLFNKICRKKIYSKTCLKGILKGPEHFSAEAMFPFNQGILW
jgi:hypothetical protein